MTIHAGVAYYFVEFDTLGIHAESREFGRLDLELTEYFEAEFGLFTIGSHFATCAPVG